MKINIEIKEYASINDILSQLPFKADVDRVEYIEVELFYTCGNFVKGEIFALIVAYIRYLEHLNKNIKITYDPDEDCQTIKYAARINFFNLIGIEFNEKFNRNETNGNFLEITEFNADNLYDVIQDTVRIFQKTLRLENSILDCVNHCFGEVVCNVDMHAESQSAGVIYAQYFPNAKKLSIFIIDCGIGFHESLKKSEEFKEISHEECLLKCCEKGVTDGSGKGIGLYHTSLFISDNDGQMKINTCGKQLIKNNKVETVIDTSHWQGSIINLELKTNKVVDYQTVFEGYEPLTFAENEECINEKIAELW